MIEEMLQSRSMKGDGRLDFKKGKKLQILRSSWKMILKNKQIS
jgi:hypothetical protein